MNSILILAPHTDDGELGCGGSIARFISEGAMVHYAAFSWLPEFQGGVLSKECEASAKLLGMTHQLFNYPVRYFSDYRQDILETMITLRETYNPDMVFAPSKYDIHQDHQSIAEEAGRAFKNTTLLGYETPWNNYEFIQNYYIRLSLEEIEKKIEALRCYESQQTRPYFDPEFIYSLARLRGMQAGCKYAEAFHAMRVMT